MLPKTLVVVDMQPFYVISGWRYTDRIIKLIRQFKDAGNPIILLEFGGANTIKKIRNAVGSYKKWMPVKKDDLSGSKEVIKECKFHLWPLDFLLCGVSYDCCVQETADALVKQYPVEVALDCTDAGSDCWHGDQLVIVTRLFDEAA